MATNKLTDAVTLELLWADLIGSHEGFETIYQEPGAFIIFDGNEICFKPASQLSKNDPTLPEFTELNKKILESVNRSINEDFCVFVFMRNGLAKIAEVPCDPDKRHEYLKGKLF